MGEISIYPKRTGRADSAITAQIQLWRANVIDLDLAVDDRRRDVARAIIALRLAVHQRDRAALHLRDLIAMATGGGVTWAA
jgi:hypothetical protein